MKALVISDIHSNIYALNEILKKENNCDVTICMGDLVDYGTKPYEVLEWFRNQKQVHVVQGNHDLHTVCTFKSVDYNHLSPQEFKWVHHNCQLLSKKDILWLENLPLHLSFEMDGYAYMIQHQYGERYEVIESSWQFDRYWEQYAPDFLQNHPNRRMIFGHTHRQCIHVLSDKALWLNPGSVSYRRPDDPDKTAHYAVIEEGHIRLCRLAYDRTPLLEVTRGYAQTQAMMTTELQDAFFFFGNAQTSRDPLQSFHEGGDSNEND